MSPTLHPSHDTPAAAQVNAQSSPRGRLTVDAPTRAFHWLFALCFAGAWITAESERWRHVHETLGYTFGGLLAFRLVYGLIGPRPARLAQLWRRASGWGDVLRRAGNGSSDFKRMGSLALGGTLLALLVAGAALVLAGHAAQADAWGLSDPLEELHEFLANTALALVLAHLGLIALLSVWRRRNLIIPMVTGRTPGPGADAVKANRLWLGGLVLAACAGFVGWQLSLPTPVSPSGENGASVEASDAVSDDTGHSPASENVDDDDDD